MNLHSNFVAKFPILSFIKGIKFSNNFWKDIKEMGGIVSKSEGETVVEMSKLIHNANVQVK